MRKQFLIRANALLGILSLMLAGCHVQKKATETQPQDEETTPPVEIKEPEPEIRPLYGVPVEPILVKYGAPPPRTKQSSESAD